MQTVFQVEFEGRKYEVEYVFQSGHGWYSRPYRLKANGQRGASILPHRNIGVTQLAWQQFKAQPEFAAHPAK